MSTDANYNARERRRRGGDQHRQRRRRDHGDADRRPLTTTEAGGTATFTVVLTTQPTADVTIALSSSDTTEGTVSAGEPDLYDRQLELAQTVTVTGVNDALVDGADHLHDRDGGGGEHRRQLQHARTPPTSLVTNSDNDAAGITVTPTAAAGDDRGRRDGDVHGGAHHAADGRRDDRAELERHDGRHGQPGEPDVYDRATGDAAQTVTVTGVNDAWSTGRSPTRS